MAKSSALRKRAKQRALLNILRRPSAVMLASLCWSTPSVLLNILLNFAPVPQERFALWYAALTILDLLISAPLFYGMTHYLLRISRGELPGITEMFAPLDSFGLIWRAIRMDLAVKLRALLWVGIPVGIPLFFWLRSDPQASPLNWGIAIALIVLGVVTGMKATTYYAGYVFAHDDPEMGVWRATREGGRLFRGHLLGLFGFALSFLPWLIVMTVILFIPFLTLAFTLLISVLTFLMSYVVTAFFAYADELRGLGQPKDEPPVQEEN